MDNKTYNDILTTIKSIINNSKWENHCFCVGGCVRDFLMGNKIKDIDIVIDLPNGGIEFARWLQENNFTKGHIVSYENFGTAMFKLKDFPEEEIESVHTRKECYHDAKSRNPETSFGTIEDDWQRRDFTINAMYYNISKEELVDFENRGQNDLKNKIIRTCGEPEIIFDEDSLRIFRMVRFACRYGFKIDEKTFESAKKFVDRLSIISHERITDEFTKMLMHSKESTKKSLYLLWDIGAFKYIIPKFHEFNTEEKFETINRLSNFFRYNGTLTLEHILACLFYNTKMTNDEIKNNCQKVLSFSNDITNEIIFLINKNKELNDICTNICVAIEEQTYKIRKIMNQCGNSKRFHATTIIGSYKVTTEFNEPNYFNNLTLFEEFDFNDYMFYTYKLPVDGFDIMKIFEIEPGKEVKEILDKTFNFVCVNPHKSSKKDCIDYIIYLKKIKEQWGTI